MNQKACQLYRDFIETALPLREWGMNVRPDKWDAATYQRFGVESSSTSQPASLSSLLLQRRQTRAQRGGGARQNDFLGRI
jgi:hypothetical protein